MRGAMSKEKPFYADVVKEFVRNLEKRTSEAIDTATEPEVDTRELRRVSEEIQISLMEANELRFLLKTQERRMDGLLRGVNKKLRELGQKPKSVFYHPKPEEDDIEDITCPHCNRKIKNFTWGLACKYCGIPIHSPYKETVQCPKCHAQFLRKDILDDQSDDYELEDGVITCYACSHRLNWKENIVDPVVYGVKTCAYCDHPYIPEKNNWKKQRLCTACKDKGVDLFNKENPGYQKAYRKRNKKGK